MLEEINSIILAATIPAKINKIFLDQYPKLISLIKPYMLKPYSMLKDIKVSGIESGISDNITYIIVTIEYYGDSNNIHMVNTMKILEKSPENIVQQLSLPENYSIKFKFKNVGPVQKRYENNEYDDDLEKIFLEFKSKRIFDNYSTAISNGIQNDLWLYHGGSHTAGILNIKYPIKNRLSTSSLSNNYVSVIMDNSQAWSKFPKRTTSLMFSNDSSSADTYGTNLYVIFPSNSANIGICPEEDIWDSFKVKFDYMSYHRIITGQSFNMGVQGLAKHVLKRNINISDYMKFKSDLDKINIWIKNNISDMIERDLYIRKKFSYNETQAILNLILYIKLKNVTLFELAEDIIKPTETDAFAIANTKNLADVFRRYNGNIWSSTSHEMWTDSPCLILTKNAIDEFKKYIAEYGLGDE